MEVLERLDLDGDEVALDAGCGSGRVTEELAKRLPEGRIVAVDGSAAMIAKARERLGRAGDLHRRRPLRARAGGAGRPRLLDRDLPLDRRPRPPLRSACGRPCARVAAWSPSAGERATSPGTRRRSPRSPSAPNSPPTSASPPAPGTSPRRRRPRGACARPASPTSAAGWSRSRWRPSDPLEFTSTVTLGPLLAQLPEELRRPFAEAVLAASEQPAGARLRAPQHRGHGRLSGRRLAPRRVESSP